jgi:hypothetical protein
MPMRAGAGRPCMGVDSQNKRPALAVSLGLLLGNPCYTTSFPLSPEAKRKTGHLLYWEVAGCATGSARLVSAHSWGGLLSLYTSGCPFPKGTW